MTPQVPVEAGALARALDTVRATLLSPIGIGFFTALCLIGNDLRRFAEIEPGYGFLGWNLFLAWIPLVLAYAISWAARRELTWPALPVLALVWIIFLPNAPYLITDLVHLRAEVNWPNAVVLLLFALTGLLIGVKSVQLFQRTVERLWGMAAGWRAVQIVAVLTAFGVYVGRVLRWNSWTLLQHPHEFAHVVLRSPSEPGRVGAALVGIVVFAGAFYVSYRVLTGARGETATFSPARAAGRAE